jgi:putrescine transport system ATP-binding protein
MASDPGAAPATPGMATPGMAARPVSPETVAPPYVRIERVTKKFGDFTAVHQVSLDVRRGEVFCLLGGSGCGKTTLLRMLAGFETPTEGRIYIDGTDVTFVPPYERPVNMMFQSYALFPHMSVEQNVAFGLRQDGVAKAEIRERVNAMLALVQLEKYGARKPHQLSGGQRQRVALARALVKRPKLLLLDEPLGALDKKLREQTQFELMDLQQDLGLTFMVVTHDQEEAMTMADRIAIMDKGEVMQVATPAEIYEAPTSRFVADFVGNVNLFEGRVAGREDGRTRISDGNGVSLLVSEAGGAADGAPEGTHVAFAIRPEKIRVSSARPQGAVNAMEGEIYDIAYLGDMTVYHVKLPDGRIIKASALNAARASDDPLTWNDKAWISFPADAGVVLVR